MKIVKPSYEIIPQPNMDRMSILKFLERIGRVCYKSEDKITDDSCIKFIEMIKDRGHSSVLEHYNFVCSVSEEIFDKVKMELSNFDTISNDPDFVVAKKFIHTTEFNHETEFGMIYDLPVYLVSGSATAFNNIAKCKSMKYGSGIDEIIRHLSYFIPELISHNVSYNSNDVFLMNDKISLFPNHVRLIHENLTVRFIIDRGISHELVRMRLASYSQSSTRYCNFSDDKFGNEITFIDPCFWHDGYPEASIRRSLWIESCQNAERTYFELLAQGAKPEEARLVLPNSLQTEIVMTANLQEWRHVFKLRTSKASHPQMREVMRPLLNECKLLYPGIFDDITY